ncbi:hypothetical protein [Haladaptatus caseinilyticus]|uniref:hypothetical protein n=1 Tax=Haladaptatus caseinilyticus TaxID=2993314 RepID=UPI00224B1E29|nr:hypothetical protein [Haladaptatus caseinilyticus]
MSLALKPLLRLGLTFAIVWFYLGLTGTWFDGWPRVLVTIALGIPTWLVVSRALFPASDSDLRLDEKWDE